MQDSLEDYIKISKNVNQGEKQQPNTQRVLTAQKKKESEARAMRIVEFLIEGKLKKEPFLSCLKYINQSYYQDVVEERALSKLCGYCLCGKRIPEMPKKQYHISTKQNKVYDITERKNFCSNFCYKASLHIKQQILTSPLWLRTPEETPCFELLPSSEVGLPGEEVDHGIIKTPKENFTSVSIFTEAAIDEMIKSEVKKKPKEKRQSCEKFESKLGTVDEDEEKEETVLDNYIKNDAEDEQARAIAHPVDNSESSRRILKQSNSINTSKGKHVGDVLGNIRKCLQEWITLETLIFLYGESTIKEQLNEKKISDYFDELKIAEQRTQQQIQYLRICKRLHLQQIAEEKFEQTVLGRKLMPVPDYRVLKEKSKELDLKVKSFYSGLLYQEENSNFPESKDSAVDFEDALDVVLPLTDSGQQIVLRRKVFLNSLNKSMQSMLCNMDLRSPKIQSEISNMVKTFRLEAHNVVFKPAVWNVVCVALLYLLSIREESLKNKLENEYIKQLMQPFPNYHTFINDVLDNVKNIDIFIKNYINKDK